MMNQSKNCKYFLTEQLIVNLCLKFNRFQETANFNVRKQQSVDHSKNFNLGSENMKDIV